MSWFSDSWEQLFGRRLRTPPISPTTQDYISIMLTVHNTKRAVKGLPLLQLNQSLNASAQQEANGCAVERRLDHNAGGTTPFSRMKKHGYNFSAAGENIAAGYGDPKSVVEAWYSDISHRANILGPYVHVGFGRDVDGRGVIYWAADYASPIDTHVASLVLSCPGGISPTDIVE